MAGSETAKDHDGRPVVVKGFLKHNKATYMKGANADIWTEVFDLMDGMRIKPTIHKVKSHLTVD